MAAEPRVSLRKSWSALDFGLHAFLAVNPLVLGLWIFSLAPLIGGNLFAAVLLAGVVMVLGAVVYGALATRWPWTGGDYTWQTRLLDARLGTVLALTSWWIVVAAIAPVYGNVVLVQVIDPLLTTLEWDGLASWFRGRDGIFAASLIAIAVATAFVGLGMRWAAVAQRILVVVGGVAFIAVLGLLFTAGPDEFSRAFNSETRETYGTGGIASSQIVQIGTLDARVGELDGVDTLRLVPLILLFALWIGWATPLAGEVRARTPQSLRAALIRVALASAVTSFVLFVAVGVSVTWDLWNEANNLYWGTVYGTTPPTPLPTWPNPVVFATWLTDSTLLRVVIIGGMAAWVVGFAATLFLAATRVLLAAASDRVVPPWVGRTRGHSVPVAALALLVVPACGLAALDAYWGTFAGWTSSAVVALALTTAGSGLAALVAHRRENRGVGLTAILFVAIVALVIGVWMADPVFGVRTVGSLVAIEVLYAIVIAYTLARRRQPGAAG
jgi:amino acid transporter